MTGHQWLDVLIVIAVALLLTWLLLLAVLAVRRRRGKMLHLEAAYRQFSSTSALPERDQRLRLRLLVLAVLGILNAVLRGLWLSRTPPEQAVESTSAQSTTPSRMPSSASPSPARSSAAEDATIQLQDSPASGRPFQPVRIQGTYRGGADTLLWVQRWEGGKWQVFPVPTKTDKSGHFTTYVELSQPGRHQLRVVDPESGVTSKPFVLVIKG
jgi:hypothetical protein